MVGDGFNEYLRLASREPIDDPVALEWVAAEERLNCYERYGPPLPQGAEPMLTREYAEKLIQRAPRTPSLEPACPSCGTILPVSLQCDYCD
jgi:hypothetical protein